MINQCNNFSRINYKLVNRVIKNTFVWLILVFIIFVPLLLFLKFDNYIDGKIMKVDSSNYLIIEKKDYLKIENKKKIKFRLEEEWFEKKSNFNSYYSNFVILEIDQIDWYYQNMINDIKIYSNKGNIFI